MKITAHFDSPDSADHAAGALARALSPLDTIETGDPAAKRQSGINAANPFAVFNTLAGTSPTYSMPIYNAAYIHSAEDRRQDFSENGCILEVTCRSDEYRKASRIIIGHGGRNISRT